MSLLKSKLIKIAILILACSLVLEFSYRGAIYLLGALKYHHEEDHYSLMMLGGSTSVGEPFHKKVSIPKLVKFALNNQINNEKIAIYNLARQGEAISYSFWQFREASSHVEPGLLLIYAGINDSYLPGEEPRFKLWKLMQYSWVISRIDTWINPFNHSQDKFEYYYTKLLKNAKQKGWRVITSSLVGNISEFDPNMNDLNFVQSKEYREWTKLTNLDDLYSASSIYENKEFDFLPIRHYYFAKVFENAGQLDSAEVYYRKAINEDYSIRPSDFKNTLIQDLSQEFKVSCIAAADSFRIYTDNVLPGYDLFMDAHHPNLKGYLILSNLFAQATAASLKLPKPKILTIENVEKEFQLTPEFYAEAYYENAKWHIIEASFTLTRRDRLNVADKYLRVASSFIEDKEDFAFWESVCFLLEKDYISWEKHFISNQNRINFKQNSNVWQLSSFQNLIEELKNKAQSEELDQNLVKEYLKKCK